MQEKFGLNKSKFYMGKLNAILKEGIKRELLRNAVRLI